MDNDPMTVALDPQAAHVDRLARVRLVEGSHHHGISQNQTSAPISNGAGAEPCPGLLLQMRVAMRSALAQWWSLVEPA